MKQLATALLHAAEMEARLTGSTVSDELKTQLTLWGAGIFRLVVMGEIKKGKSSFINAMLGEEDLVPVSSDVATSTIYKIRYGKEKGYKVHFTPESGKGVMDINAADLPRFGTEDGNPGNQEQVKFIEVVHPSPLLKSGIVIIDTPGLGGLFRGHKQITYEYVPRADAVFFVTDSVESPIGALELEYINDVRGITPHLYFVQTKCSAVDKDARLARKANNLSILSEALKCPAEKIPYFLLDSRARFRAERKKDLEKLNLSGYPQLLHFIGHSLQGNQQKLLASRALVRTLPILQHISDILTSRGEVLQARTEEEKKKLTDKLQAAQDALRTWQEDEQPRIFTKLQEGLQKIKLQAMEACNRCRPGGEIQINFEQAIHQCEDVASLQLCLAEIEQKLPEYAAEVAHQTSQALQRAANGMLGDLVPRSGKTELTLTDNSGSMYNLNTDALRRLVSTVADKNVFDNLRTRAMGGGAVAGYGSLVGGIIGSIIPFIGTAVGALLGGLVASGIGGHQAIKLKTAQELRGAKQQSCATVSQTMAAIHSKLQMSVEQLMVDINSRTTMSIQDGVRQRRNELTKQLDELRSASKADTKALEEKKNALSKDRAALAAILKVIKPWQETPTQTA